MVAEEGDGEEEGERTEPTLLSHRPLTLPPYLSLYLMHSHHPSLMRSYLPPLSLSLSPSPSHAQVHFRQYLLCKDAGLLRQLKYLISKLLTQTESGARPEPRCG